MKKTLATIMAAACLLMGVVTLTACSNAEAETDKLPTELKVGKYYLNGGTDEQYIEVYDDETICLFGFVPDPDASDVQLEDLKLFTTRRYYALNETVPFIAINDEPNGRTDGVGYGYNGTEIINFTAVINGEFVPQEYVYRAE